VRRVHSAEGTQMQRAHCAEIVLGEERVQLLLGLWEARRVSAVNEKHNGIHLHRSTCDTLRTKHLRDKV
jgi:hypothetical protein